MAERTSAERRRLIESARSIKIGEPMETVQTVQLMNSVQTVQSMQPVRTLQSMNPVQTVQSMNPVQIVQSMNQVQTVQSMNQVHTVQSMNPIQTVQSMHQVQTVQSMNPIETVQSVQYLDPVETVELLNIEEQDLVKAAVAASTGMEVSTSANLVTSGDNSVLTLSDGTVVEIVQIEEVDGQQVQSDLSEQIFVVEGGSSRSGTSTTLPDFAQAVLSLEEKQQKEEQTASNDFTVLKVADCANKGLCTGCQKLVNYHNRKRHLQLVHKISNPRCPANVAKPYAQTKCIHPDCDVHFFHRSEMMKHLEREHNVKVESKDLAFGDWDEFLNWKNLEEETNYVYFTKQFGDVRFANKVTSYFICQRDGHAKPHRKKEAIAGLANRRKNKKGRVKQGLICPARIVASRVQGEEEVVVKYTFSHNHPITLNDTAHHPLSKSKLRTIRDKLELGMTADRIFEQINGLRADDQITDQLERKHVIPRRRIDEIKKKVDIEKRLDSDERVSVHLLITELMQTKSSPIVVYRCDGVVNIEGHLHTDLLFGPGVEKLFLVVYQSARQWEMMKLHAGKLLIIDCDNAMDNNRNQLVNVLVSDEFHRAYPVAHIITNTLDQNTLNYAFSSLRDRCPDLQLTTVMTNSDHIYINAINSAFPHCTQLRHVYGRWDTIRQWEKRMKLLIITSTVRKDVSRFLSMILDEANKNRFEVLLEVFSKEFASKAEKFVKYFDRNFAFETELWALCYRDFPQMGTDSDDFMRQYFTRLEWYTNERATSKRVDDLINLISRIDEEWHTQRVRDLASMNVEQRLASKHMQGEMIPDSCVEFVRLHENGVWLVRAPNDPEKIYFVRVLMEVCTSDFCWEKCTEQLCDGLCCHLFSCSCDEASLLCEHIHKVRNFISRHGTAQESTTTLSQYELSRLEVFDENGARIQGLRGTGEMVVYSDGLHYYEDGLENLAVTESGELQSPDQMVTGVSELTETVSPAESHLAAVTGVTTTTATEVAAYEQVK